MSPEKPGFNPEAKSVEINVADDGSEEPSAETKKVLAELNEISAEVTKKDEDSKKSEVEKSLNNVAQMEDERQKQEAEAQRQLEIEAAKKKIEGLEPDADISQGETEEALQDIDDIVADKETGAVMKDIQDVMDKAA